MDKKQFRRQLLKQGFSKSEVDKYFREKDLEEVKKKANKKTKSNRKPIILYGYNTVSK